MFSIEMVMQYREGQYVKAIAVDIVRKAGAEDNRSRVIALRDYLRERVAYRDARHDDRPFLRSTAAETLRSGRGYCGEVTRAFINMAAAVGVQAHRINLYGGDNHVVAEAELRPGEEVLVDGQNPPHVRDLEPLDQVILRPEYDDYSTLNMRRLRLNWMVSHVKLELGPLTYWSENPHALKSVLWLALAMILLVGKFLFIGGRSPARRTLARRGRALVVDDRKFEAGRTKVG
ncbi:MAG TPA: transglutaminase-like domain-containing protein [Blastocatellia bacterium]|nr:transglutaminase-like domain-containing protein [Blastocatellia bacterium]